MAGTLWYRRIGLKRWIKKCFQSEKTLLRIGSLQIDFILHWHISICDPLYLALLSMLTIGHLAVAETGPCSQ